MLAYYDEFASSFAAAVPHLMVNTSGYSGILRTLLILLTAWGVWQCWKFILAPRLHPNDPVELPYRIPFLGHGIAFFKNPPAVLQQANEHFNGERAPYALTLFGTTIYVVTDPKHVAEVHKNTQSLTFEEFVITILQQSGMSKAGIKAAYTPLAKEKTGFANPNGEPMAMLVRQINIHQGYPGANLDDLDNRFVKWYDSRFRLQTLKATCKDYSSGQDIESFRVPLWKFCSEIQVQAAGDVYLGDRLRQIDPHYAHTFLEFDDLCWQILYQYPSFLTKSLTTAMKKMQATLREYVETPQEQQQAISQIEIELNEFRAIGISEKDISILLFNIFWGINTNSRKTVFWMMSYLLHNPSQIAVVRKEIAPAFQEQKIVNVTHLFEKCPRLTDIWHETLRMYSLATSARAIKEDTVIGGRLLRKGHRIMMPSRVLHFDQTVWGEDVNSFRPERFSDRSNDLTKSTSWRPFGGGKSMCTGRYVARHVAFIFTAMLLHRFDISMLESSGFPQGDISKPVLGIMSIEDNEDYMVELTERESFAV